MNITTNIKGCPFKIGEKVKIKKPCDETGYPSYEGKIGVIQYFNYDCGCSQTYPNDPMIGVKFSNKKIKEFWGEELDKRRKCGILVSS
jgi:hypothetical protein